MSLAEIASPEGDFERTPPHDLAAEQCVLGGMLMSKDAISDVMEVIRPADHYRPAHQLVHEAVLELYGRGEPADPVTVSDLLAKRGELARVGGGAYLHTLIASVPTAANAGYYARIVRERAILRRLVEVGTRIVQLGYAGDGDADELVDRAQAEIYGVTERRVSEDFLPLSEIMPGALDEIEAIGSRGGVMTGVPTGFADLDALTNGLHAGQMVVIAARPAIGKALALSCPLPTPAGWTTMGEVTVGDQLIGADGHPATVVAATEVMTGRPCYEIELSDGEVIIADGQHQWVTWSTAEHCCPACPQQPGGPSRSRPRLVTTEQIAATLRCPANGHHPHHALPSPGPACPPKPGTAAAAVGLTAATSLLAQQLQRPGLLRAPSPRLRPQAAATWRHIVDVRPVPSVPVRCVQVDSPDHLYLAGRSMVPTHNSTLALDVARAAAIKHQLTTVMFSLEMSRNEITMRLLSAEARIPLQAMRAGQLSEDDWTRLARRMSEVVDAPLFIDDSPNMSMMEIRAKCRRLKQRHDLRMVIVDYLQLMTSPRRVENRQQEVSDISRSLKLLAKELDVPVVAISQLNRGPEQRNDKRPLLSDLRESGCLTAETMLLRADTGAPVSFADLLAHGHEGVLVWSLDSQRRLTTAPLTNVFPSGVKEVFRLRLRSGRQVKATANHQFLTFGGWKPLGELAVKERLAIPRHASAPVAAGLGWAAARIGLLAHLIGDGCVLRAQPVHYTSKDEANLSFVEQAAAAEFGITPRRVQQGNWWHSYLPAPYACTWGKRNPLHVWLAELGIENLRSHEKRIPDMLYQATREELATFLHHLWATDGRIAERSSMKSGIPAISYSTTSQDLAEGILVLLARFGIIGRLAVIKEKNSTRPGYRITIADTPSMRTFCQVIGVHGARGERARRLAAELTDRSANTNVDTVPSEIWAVVKAERQRAGMSERQLQAAIGLNYCGSTLYKSNPSRARLLRIADALDSDVLRAHASSDIFWDEIAAIEPLGPQPVYDATVKGTHNFIANGIVAHNSLEQDSDVVILLHREDAYERESPRAGECDIIVAKHRNGPTTTVTVAFQGHYSRFMDMA